MKPTEQVRETLESSPILSTFEHPQEPELASTFPHHKHVPPGIKHHRGPAPSISFEQPNLTRLIKEIEREILPSSP